MLEIKRPTKPVTVIPHIEHDTHNLVKRPVLVDEKEIFVDDTHSVTVQIHKQKRTGYIVSCEAKAVDGFFATRRAAKAAIFEFAESLAVAGAIWISIFVVLAWLFPGVS